MDPIRLLEYTQSQQPAMLDTLAELVGYESPSTDKTRLDGLAAHLAARFRAIGADVTIVDNATSGNHVRVAIPSADPTNNARQALLIGHFDTVWSVGTLAQRPFRIERGKAYGPGAFDMKGGIVLAEFALRALADLAIPLPRPIVIVLNSDEETGSRSSEALIETEARQSEYVLVLEPAAPGGALKTARKGIGAFTVEVEGRAVHAGVEPEKGVSAIEELARQILYLHSLTDLERGVTLNAGIIEGGTRSNVVAAHAKTRVDVRAWTVEEARRIEALIRGIQPVHPEARITVRGGFGRLPMERTPGTVALFEHAQRIGRALGQDLQETSSGGGSDGNITSALGISTLDGLGVEGDGAHADYEHVEIASLPVRAALLAGLLATL